MKKRYAAAIVAIIIFVAVIALRRADSNIITVPAEVTTVENAVSTKGFIVRDEYMYYATTDGTVYFNAVEGERVSKDAQIATIFEGRVSEDSIKELSVIDAKLKRAYETESSNILHRSDTGSLENDLMTRISEIYDYADTSDIEKISAVHDAVDSLRMTGEYDVDAGVDRLEDEKWQTLEKIGRERKDIYTEISGVFSTYLDGLESVLVPDRMDEYTPSYIKGLHDRQSSEAATYEVAIGDPICKVMNNHVWYTLMTVGEAKAEECKKGRDVKLRFKNMGNAEVSGTIDYVSDPDDDGERLVMIRCSTYVESVFSYRDVDTDIVFKSYTGYKVPIHAIRTIDDKTYVIGQSDNSTFRCRVDIVYTDKEGEYAIVASSDDAENKISRAKNIIVSDTK